MKTAGICPVGVVIAILLTNVLGAENSSVQSGEPIKDFSDIKVADFGVKQIDPTKSAKSGFIIGGKNPTELLKTLTEINGKAIADLEKVMRPGESSTSGFLGKEERLLDVLAADNKYVVDDLGLTHQELAKHLHAMGAVWLSQLKDKQEGAEFLYHGRKYKVTAISTRGFQDSPFGDGTKSGTNVVVHNLSNGNKLEYAWLVAYMVERFGFYEGKGTPYRVEPRKVVEVFDFVKKMDEQD